jgi:drug/metabolite transporter (DMT)-like permease
MAAFVYLVAFGSCWGYGSYVWLLRHVPAVRVAAFAYVNPVVAIVLGWLLLGEPIGPFTVVGTLVILPGVVLAVSSPAPRAAG